MKRTVGGIRELLISTTDGGVACDAINALAKHVQKGNMEAKAVLAEYAGNGPVEHMRSFACATLAKLVDESDFATVEVFRCGLSDETNRYWSILGYINVLGRGAYESLTEIAYNVSISVEDRSKAVKCLALCSKQGFDRQLPSDPGAWKPTDLRVSEIEAWAKAGYPDGHGHTTPSRHPALDKPKTAFEKIASCFDKKLAKKRSKEQDDANATNWLADPDDIERIAARWKLPHMYLDFLTRFSPINVTLQSRRFYNHFQLFGAGELIEAQDGYSFNPVEQKPIEDWPASYLVIASHGGDPFVLDLSQSDTNDAPVLTAEHGLGKWGFNEEAESFAQFLKSLSK